jgi:hypothetical protein
LIHHQPVTEALICDAQNLLAQVPTVGVHHGKGGIVADRTDVSEMIGEPFELAHQGTQPDGAYGDFDAVRCLDRPGEGEGIGHGAVAGNPPRKYRRTINRHSLHEPFSSLVHVAKALLEPHDGLAVRREPEVTRFDDARMHGAHRDLVQAFTLGGQESVAIWDL